MVRSYSSIFPNLVGSCGWESLLSALRNKNSAWVWVFRRNSSTSVWRSREMRDLLSFPALWYSPTCWLLLSPENKTTYLIVPTGNIDCKHKLKKGSPKVHSTGFNFCLTLSISSIIFSLVSVRVILRALNGGGVAGLLLPPRSVKTPKGSSSSVAQGMSSARGGVQQVSGSRYFFRVLCSARSPREF